jgi:DNA-binding response OmpR family regulator
MKTIILIEDNQDIRETTAEILELADYKVFTSDNGKSGVEMAKKEKPNLIICDIMLPDLDGYGVLRILSKSPETSHIPFIFLTAKAEKSDVRKGMNLGADDYITKPFKETELLEAIESRLQRCKSLKNDKANIEQLNEFIDEARGLEELKGLSQDRKIRTFRKKEVIFREDDYANYTYFITKGKVKCLKTDNYDKTFVNAIRGENEFIGYINLLEGNEYHETAIAMENTEVAVIPKQDFLALIHNNGSVAAKFIKMLSGNVKERENRLLQLAYAPIRERLADALIKLTETEHMKNGTPGQLKISREDLASIVGTAKESLIRTLSHLKKEGLLDTNGQEIKILDEEGLKKAAIGF